jgi:hypothetical protein
MFQLDLQIIKIYKTLFLFKKISKIENTLIKFFLTLHVAITTPMQARKTKASVFGDSQKKLINIQNLLHVNFIIR